MDNYERWEAYDAEQNRSQDKLPKCDFCGEVIQDDYLFDIGDIYCEECMEERFKKPTERYMRG